MKIASPLDIIKAARAAHAAGDIAGARVLIKFALNDISIARAAGVTGTGIDAAEKLARRLAGEWA